MPPAANRGWRQVKGHALSSSPDTTGVNTRAAHAFGYIGRQAWRDIEEFKVQKGSRGRGGRL